MKKVIYTVITGDYDQLIEISEKNPEFDYVCLTDQPDTLASETWQIQKLESNELSPVKLSRLPKLKPFDFFPEYDIAIYVDANVHIKADLQPILDKYLDQVIVAKHPYRNCLYREEKDVLRIGRDYEENTHKQIKKYHEEGFPENFGLSHCNFIVWHNTPEVKAFSARWWNEVYNYSHRDQLSFDYVRWVMSDKISIKHITPQEKGKYVKKVKHKKSREYPAQMKNEGVDVVYPLSKYKKWGDNELRFSIRSVVKHFKDLRNIVVIGERKPEWLKNAIFIKVNDDQQYRDANLIKKLIAACKDKYVSDQFLWAADDKFLCEDITFKELCGWHIKDINYSNPTAWEKQVLNTKKELEKRGDPVKDYNLAHAFQPVDKADFLEIIESWDWQKIAYTDMNIYQNSTALFQGKDCTNFHVRFREPFDHAQIIKKLDGKTSFNINTEALNEAMKQTLSQFYPERSNYEITGLGNDAWEEYKEWLETKHFWQGVQLIKKHTRNRHLIKYFEKKGKSKKTQKVLENNLKIIARKWKKK